MKLLIVCFFLMSVYMAQGQMYGGEWMSHLFKNIDRMQNHLRENLNTINHQIQEDIRAVEEQTKEVTDNIQRVAEAGSGGDQTINIGQTVSMNSVPGGSKIVYSGYSTDGEPYIREVEERVIGNTLHHKEKITNPSRDTIKVFKYTLDLSDPTASPILETN